MKYVHWNYIKQVATNNNIVSRLQYVIKLDSYFIWLEVGSETYLTSFKFGTDAAKEFETKYISKIVSNVDDFGKEYVTMYSGNQGIETVVYTTRGDTLDYIGAGDSSYITGDKFIDNKYIQYLQFNEEYRILRGVIFWENGNMDITGDCYIILPKGAPIGMDMAGNIIFAPIEIPISHFVIEQRLPGTNTNGLEIKGERATDLIPPYCLVKIVWKANNVTQEELDKFKAFIRFDMYRSKSL